jgi:branched-chain amino acid transport system substrate-binding protein
MRSPAYGRGDEWYSFRLFINNTNGEPVRLLLAVFLSSLASVYSGAVKAQISYDLVRIGMLNDQSGIYADFGGTGSVIAARMAVEDAGRKVLEKPIDIVVGDHQSKADIGTAIARQWFDAEKVDVTIGFDNSSVALAVEQVALQKNRIAIAGAVATTAFTRPCGRI